MPHLIALDQGTTSSRAIVVDETGQLVGIGQLEHEQHFPAPGWVEHDAREIWRNTERVIELALGQAGLTGAEIAAIGITNQRETTVVWDRATGEPVHRAIVWQDTRTQSAVEALAARPEAPRVSELTGLPIATYFSATKITWMLEQVPGARERAERGELLVGTTDSWLLWNLTGGPDGGVHATDVTNASRTLLMGLESLAWEPELLELFAVPAAMLPEIRSSSEVYGTVAGGPLAGVPVAGILGDQQAATFGQAAFDAGESKCTYGTGSFIIVGTGTDAVRSSNGLITTVAYQLGDAAPHYALEGSIAVAGSLVQWLRDNLGIISSSADVEELALSVDDNGGVYIVPAFSGLFAPYWRPDARGVITGLTRYATKAHLARASLEAVAFQVTDVLDALASDMSAAEAGHAAGERIAELRVDGGMVRNAALMQFQADLLGIPVVRPAIIETTALGAAFAAGLAVGVWPDLEALRGLWREDARFEPAMSADEREHRLAQWHKAVQRSLDWED